MLVPHSAAPAGFVRSLEAQVSVAANGVLNVRYVLRADMDRVRLAPPAPAARRDELWKRTCFEAFIAEGPNAAYRELNFSPSSEWAMYSFTGYRQGMAPLETVPPEIRTERSAQQLTLDARVLTGLGAAHRIALAAVIEDENGRLSYWALRHPPGKPDFHHSESFVALS